MDGNDAVKFFTLEEANATLPLVRRIVDDIVAEGQRVESLLAVLEKGRSSKADQGAATDDESANASSVPLSPKEEALREDVAKASAQLEQYLAELSQIGCLFKGPRGTVDFYSMLDGRPVFLCWTLGEDEIQFWHELEAGFAGREPLISGSISGPELGYGREG